MTTKVWARYGRRPIRVFVSLPLALGMIAGVLTAPPASAAHTDVTIDTISVSGSPAGIGVNPTTNRIYVARVNANKVSVIDGTTNAEITEITTGSGVVLANNSGVGVNPTTNKVYVANPGGDYVSVIDGGTNTETLRVTVGDAPGAVDVNPSTNKVYVANLLSDSVSVIDGATNAVEATILVGLAPQAPQDLDVNATTNRVYVANTVAGTVSVIDGTNTVIATVFVGGGPRGVAVNPNTNKIYVAQATANSVAVIDGDTNTVAASTIPVGDAPFWPDVNPDTNRIYVPNTLGDSISVIDGETDLVVSTHTIGAQPVDVALNPSTDRAYSANFSGNSVSVLSTATDFTDLSQGGSLLQNIWIAGPLGPNGALSCQVFHDDVGFNQNEWESNPDDPRAGFCGTYLHVGDQLYGPDGTSLSPPDVEHYDVVSVSDVMGNGSRDDPFRVVTVVTVGDTGIRLTETDSFVTRFFDGTSTMPGDESYRTDVTLENTTGTSIPFALYRAADCSFSTDSDPPATDTGFGFHDPDTDTVGCVQASGGAKKMLTPLTGGSHYVEAPVGEVFGPDTGMVAGDQFPDTLVAQTDATDDAVGLSWGGSLAPGESQTFSNEQTFSPYALTLRAVNSTVAPGNIVDYEITIDPLETFQDIDAVVVVLPDGFGLPEGFSLDSYAYGFIAEEASNYSVSGNVVTFNGPFSLDYSEPRVGGFYAEAGGCGGTSSAYTLVGNSHGSPTGPTAPVVVTGSACEGAPTNLHLNVSPNESATGFASIDETDLSLAGTSLDPGGLAGSAGPQAAPLGKNPLGKNPLGKNPLGKNPLGKNPLGKNPLGKNPLGKNGLNDTDPPLRDAPANTLINHHLSEPPLLSSMPIDRTGGWQGVLGTDVPLQTLTLNDAIDSTLWGNGNIKITDIDWSQTRFGDFSPAAWLLGETHLNDVTLPGGATWPALLAGMGPGCDTYDPSTTTFVDLQWARCDLTMIPWGEIHLSDVANLGGSPLGYFKLDGILLSYTPLGDVDATGFTFVNCAAVPSGHPCTLAEAQDADAIDHSAEVRDLPSSALATTSFDELLAGMIDVTRFPYEAMTLGQIIGATVLDGVNQPTVEYAATMDITCPGAVGTEINLTLPSENFRYVPDSAQYLFDDTSLPADPPSEDDGTLTFTVPPDVCTGVSGLMALELDLSVVPGPNGGTYTSSLSATSEGFDTVTSDDDAPLTLTENQEIGNSLESATPIEPNVLYTGTIGTTGDTDYFTLPPADPGTIVAVYLSHLTQDDDLVMYGPAADVVSLRSAALDLHPLGKNPVDDNGSCLPPDYVVQPQTLEDVPVSSDLSLALASFSTNRSTQEEIACTIAKEGATGDLTIAVTGFDGAHANESYVLRVLEIPPAESPACSLPPFAGTGLTVTGPGSIPSDTQTLILINAERFGQIYGNAAEGDVMSSLQQLATATDSVTGDPLVNGVVVPVENDFDVAAAYSNLDSDPCSPLAADRVVQAINAYVDQLRTTNGLTQLKFIVLVGSDNVIPQARVADLTALGNQTEYQGDVRPDGTDNPISRAFAQGYILTDDPYGSFSPIPWNGNQLYLPNVSVGRLVETPSEIQDQITQFRTYDGRLNPSSALVTGYDFTKDAATDILDTLTAIGASGESLINDSWTHDQLITNLSAGPRVIALNGHFDHFRTQTANGQIVTDREFLGMDGSSADVPNRVLMFTLGCNSGVSFPDVWVTSPTPATLDWAQALSRKKGELVGNTGFGYGDDTTIAYSERLMTLFTENLDGSMSVGQALALAKGLYYGSQATVGSYDIKSLEESTFYGLPMYRIGASGVVAGGPASPTTAGGPGALAASTSIPILDPHTDPDTGLAAVDVGIDPFIDESTDRHTTLRGDYFSGPNVQVTQFRPIEPISAPFDMTKAGHQLHDALVTDLTKQDIPGFDPVMAVPTLDLSDNEPEPLVTDVVFPTDFVATSSAQTILGRRDFMVVDGGRYVGDPATPGEGTQRIYTSEDVRAFYSDSTDYTRPHLDTIEALALGDGQVSFVVNTHDPDDDVAQVYVMYLPAGSDTFVLKRLTTSGGSLWTGTVTADVEEYFVQAVDTHGNVGVSTFKGVAVPATEATPPPAGVDVTVTGELQNGWYRDTAHVEVTSAGTETFEASVDGGDAQPVPVDVSGDGAHTVDYEGDEGSSGTAIVPVDSSAPVVGLTLGDPKGGGPPPYVGKTTPITVNVADGASGVQGCTILVTGTGAPSPSCSGGSNTFTIGSGGATGSYTVDVQATDKTGHQTVTTFLVDLDADAPSVTLEIPGTGTPPVVESGKTYITSNTDLRMTSSDALSGVGSCTIGFTGAGTGTRPCDPTTVNTFTIGGPDGDDTVDASATDRAGNTGNATPLAVTLDNTAPSFGDCPTPSGPVYLHGTSSVTITATDAGVGMDAENSQLTKTIDTGSVGASSVTFTAKDKLGNTSTKTCSYAVIYKFSGFFPPVDNTLVNSVKAGQGVPFKWNLTDANGVAISDPSSFVNLFSSTSPGACSGTPDTLETTTTNSGLKYNGNGNWQFDWQTPKSYAGSCRTAKITLNDGTTHSAVFRFR